MTKLYKNGFSWCHVLLLLLLGDLFTVTMKEHQENKTQIKGHENSPRLCSDTEFMGVENTAATIAPFFKQSLKKV